MKVVLSARGEEGVDHMLKSLQKVNNTSASHLLKQVWVIRRPTENVDGIF